jgi:NADPH-dependent 2,4-dienoyl-CoA reductase/sulfur reductase-like enzyme
VRAVAQRGGIMINDSCQTSDPDIYAIGECASWNNRVYGLVAPGYKMAQVAVDHLLGSENASPAPTQRQAEAAGRGRGGSAMPTAARRAPAATSISTKAKKSISA